MKPLFILFLLACVVVGSVQAADLRITDVTPDLFFEDTSDAGDNWRVVGRESNFGVWDDVDDHYVVWVSKTNGNSALTFNSIFVESDGDIRWGNGALFLDKSAEYLGLGTTAPTRHFHIKTGSTPTIRLEQDGTSGFSPQIWDVVGNEFHFVIRDVTNSSLTPFQIRTGAPTTSLLIAANGNIGIGTGGPASSMHILRTDGTAGLLVQEANAAAAPRTLFALKNKGNTKFEIEETGTGNSWAFTNSGDDFRISLQGSGVVEFRVDNDGDAFLESGTLTENSDVNAKQSIEPVDPGEILDRVAALPIAEWEYIDTPGVRHIGPMAQDFHAAFALGKTDKGIAMLDSSGVALAAIKALKEHNQALQAQNDSLEHRLSHLERSLAGVLAESGDLNRARSLAQSAGKVSIRESGFAPSACAASWRPCRKACNE